MATGDTFGGQTQRGNHGIELLTVTAADNGEWIDILGVKDGSVHVVGLEAGGTITVHLSNIKTQPANSDHHVTDLTINTAGESITKLTKLPARFIKAKKAAGGSPTATNVYFIGLER